MDQATREFRVFNKATSQWGEVKGVANLSKVLGVPVEEIPTISILKITYDNHVVVEIPSKA